MGTSHIEGVGMPGAKQVDRGRMGPVLVAGWPPRTLPRVAEALHRYGGEPLVPPGTGHLVSCGTRAVLLGPALPRSRCLALCRRIGATTPQPVIVALPRTDADLEIRLLDAGARDVVGPGARPDVIAARLNRHLAPIACRVEFGNIVCEPGRRRVAIAGCDVRVSATHFRLLALLLTAGSAVVTRAEVASVIRGRPDMRLAHVIDAQISRLRKVLAEHGGSHGPVAVRGVGYRLDPRPGYRAR